MEPSKLVAVKASATATTTTTAAASQQQHCQDAIHPNHPNNQINQINYNNHHFNQINHHYTHHINDASTTVVRTTLHQIVLRLPDRAAYAEAHRRAPQVVASETLAFWRHAQGDAWAAAKRMANYWTHRYLVFGDDAFCRPLAAVDDTAYWLSHHPPILYVNGHHYTTSCAALVWSLESQLAEALWNNKTTTDHERLLVLVHVPVATTQAWLHQAQQMGRLVREAFRLPRLHNHAATTSVGNSSNVHVTLLCPPGQFLPSVLVEALNVAASSCVHVVVEQQSALLTHWEQVLGLDRRLLPVALGGKVPPPQQTSVEASCHHKRSSEAASLPSMSGKQARRALRDDDKTPRAATITTTTHGTTIPQQQPPSVTKTAKGTPRCVSASPGSMGPATLPPTTTATTPTSTAATTTTQHAVAKTVTKRATIPARYLPTSKQKSLLPTDIFTNLSKEVPDSKSLHTALFDLEQLVSECRPEDKAAYEEALAKHPQLVSRESNPTRYLRDTDLNVAVATKRLLLYWRRRKQIFGTRAFLPLDQTCEGALERRDVTALQSGFLVHLPCHPQDGCSVLYCDGTKLRKASNASLLRCVFYMWHVMAENPETQREGIRLLYWVTDTSFATAFKFCYQHVRDCIPVRIKKIHYLGLPWGEDMTLSDVKSIAQSSHEILQFQWDGLRRANTFFHVGTIRTDIGRAVMVEHGYAKRGLPVSVSGEWTYKDFVKWQELRIRHEWSLFIADTEEETATSYCIPTCPVATKEETEAGRVERKRKMMIVHSRNKRERQKMALEAMREQAMQLEDVRTKLQRDQNGLLQLLAEAQEIIDSLPK